MVEELRIGLSLEDGQDMSRLTRHTGGVTEKIDWRKSKLDLLVEGRAISPVGQTIAQCKYLCQDFT